MKRALLLEAGRFRAYVNDGKATIDPPFSEVTRDDAAALAELSAAIKVEIAAQTGAQPMNDAALRAMLAMQQNAAAAGMLGTSWMQNVGGALFGIPRPTWNPYG